MAYSTVIFLIAICALILVNKSLGDTKESFESRGVDRDEKKSFPVVEKIDQSKEISRDKRSPQFFEIYDDYTESRHSKFAHGRKKHRKPYFVGPHGGQGDCRGHGCPQGHGWRPQQGGYYHQGHNGGQSYASASAGSSLPHNGVGQSQANAQSATFSLGPYSATFSHAQASAGNLNNRPRDFFNY